MKPLSSTDLDMLRSLQSNRDALVSGIFTDTHGLVATLDCLIQRIRGGRKQHRPYGQLKALVAATPQGFVLHATNYSHATSLRAAAKSMKRRVRINRVAPGKPARLVTLLT